MNRKTLLLAIIILSIIIFLLILLVVIYKPVDEIENDFEDREKEALEKIEDPSFIDDLDSLFADDYDDLESSIVSTD